MGMTCPIQGCHSAEWLSKKLRNGFFIFNKNEFPSFTNTSYDPILFEIINSAYIIKARLSDFLDILEGIFNGKNVKEALLKDKILSGLKVFEINPKGNMHLDFIESLGAIIPDTVKNNSIPISGDNAIKLRNWNSYINDKYDITFSNELMDENSGIKYEQHSAVFSSFEIYAIFANITKKNGFSLHSNGSAISSLYETYFQFIGFKVVEYFRNSDGNFNFTTIMKKINEKQTSYDEFFYIYTELKKRWPTRYGN